MMFGHFVFPGRWSTHFGCHCIVIHLIYFAPYLFFAHNFLLFQFLSIVRLSSSFHDDVDSILVLIYAHSGLGIGGARGKYIGSFIAIISKGCWHARQ